MTKFKIIFWGDNPERSSIVNEFNNLNKYFIGLNGLLYENYGTDKKPLFEPVFDADYEIEIEKICKCGANWSDINSYQCTKCGEFLTNEISLSDLNIMKNVLESELRKIDKFRGRNNLNKEEEIELKRLNNLDDKLDMVKKKLLMITELKLENNG